MEPSFWAAQRMRRIKPSPSTMASQRARELKAGGRDVIALSSGEPDFATPEHVIEAAYVAMRRGETRYTNTGGTPELKAAVIEKFERDNGLAFEPAEVMAASGGKQVIYNALMATIDEGDEVVVPAPYWVSYPDMVRVAGGQPVIVPCAPEQGFKLTADALARALTPRTRWLILNAPGNPSGAVYDQADLRALAEVLLEHPRVAILCDDVYEHIVYDGRRFATMAAVQPRLRERTLTVNGVSKAYAMTGWRIGFAGGPKALIAEMTKLQSQSTSNPSSISQAAAVAALTGPQDMLAPRARTFQERRDLVVSMLNQARGLACPSPAGAFYVYPSCAGMLGSTTPSGRRLETDLDVIEYLLESEGVAVVHGEAYGLSPHFRISFAAATAELEEACRRIQRACAALR